MAENTLSLKERVEHRVARTLLRLPHHLQRFLSGTPPVERNGLTLHPELQLLLALRKRMGAVDVSTLPPAEARRRMRREALVHAGEPIEVGAVRELVLDVAHGPLKARHYAPVDGAARRPMLVFLHGGGFVLGDLDTHDSACRLLCRHAGLHVLSIDYRLAPEHPFPAALEDVTAAFAWACAHAGELGADPARVAVGGDSAGGNLAAVVSQLAVRDGTPRPALQFLLYPAVDRTVDRESLEHFAEGFFLTRADVAWYQMHYMGAFRSEGPDPRLSPLVCRDLSGLPPALVVTAGFDPLRDEGEAYARALQAAGTPARLRRFDSLIHGFANMTGVSQACRDAVVEIAALLRTHFDGVSP
ncbi:alpha/beta hydrolase [Archangium violaceum]|uniref:alpha/beta hydrolase n=1 Tax=Archangium violaceum TaxID=83451 RepID=UPI00194E4535|nr:alpha/beta hydrolase [Archangium violaceum]QRN96930.1 alpha/beta hydrolase [Archangium violaceum]